MILLDALIRFSGVGLLLLLAAITLRNLRGWRCAPYLLMACLTVTAAFLGLTIDPFKLPQSLHIVVRFLDIPHLIFVWLFALSLFRTDFVLRPFHFLVGVIYCFPIFVVRLYQFGVIEWRPLVFIYLVDILSILLMGHLIITTLRGRMDDLQEKRRSARVYFVIIIAFVTVSAALIEAVLITAPTTPRATLWIASIWPAIVWTCFWLLSADKTVINFEDSFVEKPDLNQQDRELKSKLETVMKIEEFFKTHDLTILILAKKLGVTQHRLRALINQSLGYDNFSAFVNAYRVEAVKARLSDPDKAHLPILTIAMDCGFKSLSPFNRAFRASEGVTPSQFRRVQSEM